VLPSDPSGIDMPRVADRDLKMFAGFPDVPFDMVRRVALNLDQVRQLAIGHDRRALGR
jgi:hypothetical protein